MGQVGDAVLESLAERNLADCCEYERDLPGVLRYLQRYRDAARRGGAAALEADAYRRLSSIYAQIAAGATHGRERAWNKGGGIVAGGDNSLSKAGAGDEPGDEAVEEEAQVHTIR